MPLLSFSGHCRRCDRTVRTKIPSRGGQDKTGFDTELVRCKKCGTAVQCSKSQKDKRLSDEYACSFFLSPKQVRAGDIPVETFPEYRSE